MGSRGVWTCARLARSIRSRQGIHPREQLVAERFDSIDCICGALMNALEPLLLLREAAIDAFEPLQDLRADLLQPQHAVVLATNMPARKPRKPRQNRLNPENACRN